MIIKYTKHAMARMRERSISKEAIERAIQQPDKLQASTKSSGRFIAKKIWRGGDGKHVLLIIFEHDRDCVKIVTVIDTSKIEKYY